jgi:hypothetical protein
MFLVSFSDRLWWATVIGQVNKNRYDRWGGGGITRRSTCGPGSSDFQEGSWSLWQSRRCSVDFQAPGTPRGSGTPSGSAASETRPWTWSTRPGVHLISHFRTKFTNLTELGWTTHKIVHSTKNPGRFTIWWKLVRNSRINIYPRKCFDQKNIKI